MIAQQTGPEVPPPTPPCKACEAKPTGAEGHEALRVRALGAASMQFVCRECGSLWARQDCGSGNFAWTPVEAGLLGDRLTPLAVPLPQR